MKRPAPPSSEVLEFLATAIEKMLNAAPRSENLSSTYLTLPKNVQLETERHSRKVAERAARIVAERIQDSGRSPDSWNEVPQEEMESILRQSIERAQRELREADDVEPEETRRSS